MNFYNENDPKAAAWLRNLIEQKLIPNGYVDERSIKEVQASDLAGYTQCHFFAGIGGWSYALQLAGWPDDVPVWTGSCPCQPLSCAGKRAGEMDERHLWPDFYRLIAECRPATVFGEQVASSDGLEWLDGISLDLEECGYAIGAASLPAASEGAPHGRHRIFWVADAGISTSQRNAGKIPRAKAGKRGANRQEHGNRSERPANGSHAHAQGMDDTSGIEGGERASVAMQRGRADEAEQASVGSGGSVQVLGDSAGTGQQEQWREYRPSGEGSSGLVGFAMQAGVPEWNGPTIAVKCSDGSRRVSAQPGSFPLAHGLPARMGRLRGYGNAIVPQVAVKFIKAFTQGVPSHDDPRKISRIVRRLQNRSG